MDPVVVRTLSDTPTAYEPGDSGPLNVSVARSVTGE